MLNTTRFFIFLLILLLSVEARADMGRAIYNSPPPPPIEKVTDIFQLIERSEEKGALEKLEAELKAGVNIEQVSDYGNTPLISAVQMTATQEATEIRRKRYDAVLLLLKYGANINAKGVEGLTALHFAAANNDVNLTYLLLEKGADINAVSTETTFNNRPGLTPLDKCFPFGPDVFNILLHKGAKYDVSAMLNQLIWWKDTGRKFLEYFLARPVEVPEDFKKSLDDATRENNREGAYIVDTIRKHMDMMAAAKKNNRSPIPLFKLQPPFPQQTVPPLSDPELIVAVRNGDIASVKALLDKGADASAVSAVSQKIPPTSALHIALTNNRDDIASLLVDHGAQVNWRDAEGNAPFLIAVHNGRAPMIQKLLDKGADVNIAAVTPSASRALEMTDDLKILDLLIQHGAEVNYQSPYSSLVRTWIGKYNTGILSYFLGKGADINVKDYKDRTPLLNLFYWQSMSHKKEDEVSLDFIKFLVEHGADLKAKDRENFTAYDWAVKIKRQDIADYLQKAGAVTGDQKAAFHDAIRRGDVETVTKILNQGFDPNTENYVFAVLTEMPDYTVDNFSGGEHKIPHAKEIVYLLAKHGANVKASGHSGQSVLHVTTDPELIDYFVAHGVDVNGVDDKRNTPLHVMAAGADVEAVRALLKNGAFPNAITSTSYLNKQGDSPLDLALLGPSDQRPGDGPPPDFEHEGPKYLAVIKLLMEAGADASHYTSGGIKIERWAGDDTAEGYKEFDHKALEIMELTHVPVAQKH